MLFHNLGFLLFLAATFALYWRLPAARLWLLALANALFYLAAGWANLGLFLGASLATYLLGRVVTGPWGGWALGLGIALNVANLGFFKYAGFVTGTLHPLLPLPFLDPALVKDVLLPIGISFYTFQHISYLVDRRFKQLPEAPSYLQFWVYISFFGHSIAGPIMRGHEFFPQIAESTRKAFDAHACRLGLALFAWGFFKKVAIADQLAPGVNRLFGAPWQLDFVDAWSAALLFAFQIYYDFSAYSDMAVGIGLLFGYTLRQNFRTPYVAADASEFWRRWHITLSEWIRDYVYIPLGGNRSGLARAQLNLFLAMLISGLWHGANWTFVLWGAWHGLLLLSQRGLGAVKARLGWGFFAGPAYRAIAIGSFFLLTTIGWVLFRAADLDVALAILGAMGAVWTVDVTRVTARAALLFAGLYALHWAEWAVRERWPDQALARLRATPAPLRGLAYAAIALIAMASYGTDQDFIYFRF